MHNLYLNPASTRCQNDKYPEELGFSYSRSGYSHDSQFACRHCGKRYRWKSTMRRHEQVECGGKEPTFKCPDCPYRAKQKGNLGVHMRKHHSAQEFCTKNCFSFEDVAINNNNYSSTNNNLSAEEPL
ncbi:hypothetical protein HUJ04_008561 [Dendroctonus ponderosae]|nr:hypothetical protein HUJ04_008561 [Dendroctonus ponderosae]KAH1008468.1 hypothetical protein HUJ05_009021 [Dendroctonus ponderosae]